MGQAGLSPGASVRTVTEDGFELTMASNFFGHVLLTDLLLPALKRAAREDGGDGYILRKKERIALSHAWHKKSVP